MMTKISSKMYNLKIKGIKANNKESKMMRMKKKK